jgi:hypothetical protein
LRSVALLALVLVVALAASPPSFAISQSSVDGGYSAVQAGFVAAQGAAREGGNVSALTAQLNAALSLIRSAVAENATDPAQASADLASAVLMAQNVTSAAGAVGQAGAAAKLVQLYVSLGSAVVILALAAVVYLFGDRAYHRLWLRAYGGHVVKKVG